MSSDERRALLIDSCGLSPRPVKEKIPSKGKTIPRPLVADSESSDLHGVGKSPVQEGTSKGRTIPRPSDESDLDPNIKGLETSSVSDVGSESLSNLDLDALSEACASMSEACASVAAICSRLKKRQKEDNKSSKKARVE